MSAFRGQMFFSYRSFLPDSSFWSITSRSILVKNTDLSCGIWDIDRINLTAGSGCYLCELTTYMLEVTSKSTPDLKRQWYLEGGVSQTKHTFLHLTFYRLMLMTDEVVLVVDRHRWSMLLTALRNSLLSGWTIVVWFNWVEVVVQARVICVLWLLSCYCNLVISGNCCLSGVT